MPKYYVSAVPVGLWKTFLTILQPRFVKYDTILYFYNIKQRKEMETKTIKTGAIVNIFTGTAWEQTKPTKKEIITKGTFTKFGSFSFKMKLSGVVYNCTVSDKDLINN